MKDCKEIADMIVEATLHLKKGMTDAGFHLDIRHHVVEKFATEMIEYEFSKMRAGDIKELGDLATAPKELSE